jgi:membrane protein required for colicin V production
MGELSAFDIFVLLIVAISVFFGALRGFVRTVFGLGAWLLAIFGPLYLIPMFVPGGLGALGGPFPPWVNNVLAFFIILVTLQLTGSFLAGLIAKAGLGGTDRVLGAVLGCARALLVLLISVVIIAAFGGHRSESWMQSKSRPLLETLLAFAQPLLGNSIKASDPVKSTQRVTKPLATTGLKVLKPVFVSTPLL